jgi:hypothetical protein
VAPHAVWEGDEYTRSEPDIFYNANLVLVAAELQGG